MRPFFWGLLRAGVMLSAVLEKAYGRLQGLFRSKAEVEKRGAERVRALSRREMEVERLDRLRNPQNYRGR